MTIASSSSERLITLKTSDGGVFQVEESMALLSETIKLAIAENSDSTVLLQDVKSPGLAAIIRYMNEVSSGDGSSDSFAKQLPREMLFCVVMAAYFLKIKPLVDSLCQTIAGMMIGRSTEEIREMFNIENDYTEAEFNQVKKEISFALVGMDKKMQSPVGPDSGRRRLTPEERRRRIHVTHVMAARKAAAEAARKNSGEFGPITRSDSIALLLETMDPAIHGNPTKFRRIRSPVMTMVLRYMYKVCHGDESSDDFAKGLARDEGLLTGVLMAANFLKIEPLSNLVCETIVGVMGRGSVDAVRDLFHDVPVCWEVEVKEAEAQISSCLEEARKQTEAAERLQAMEGNRGEVKRAASSHEPIL